MKRKFTRQFLFTIIIIFVLQSFMLVYLFSYFYQSSAADIRDMGVSNLKSEALMIENYLNKGRNVLWFAAESVDFMLREGTGKEKILEYLTGATNQMTQQFDENFTGIYGYLDGTYIDGAGWTPPDGYDPTQRSWYTEAAAADRNMVLSAPYLDAQTGEIVISFSQMLSDGKSVIALDIVLNEVQNVTDNMTVGGIGYAFIMDNEFLVVAHADRSEVGKNYAAEGGAKAELVANIRNSLTGEFEMNINGEVCTVFSDEIAREWYVVIVASNTQMFKKLNTRLLAGVSLSLMIYLIIVVFCVIFVKRASKAEENERKSAERLDRMNMSIIRSLASTIDAKDRYTSGHSQRVADYSVRIAQRMGKSEEELKTVFYAGLLHDVGKIRVPEEVINKPGRLTDDEFEQIKIHPVSGYHILRDIHDDERIGYGARYHHERYDGKGYPNGLEGEGIPEIARIIAVADSYDAMTSSRSYRNALPQDIVRREIERGKGAQFDPRMADIMLGMIDEDKNYEMCEHKESTRSVLVVDDDPINIKIVGHILKKMDNLNVIGANTKDEVFSILKTTDVSLVMLDLVMPDIDGFALFELIHAEYDIPVILMTSEKSVDIMQKIRKLKIDDYLTKPLSPLVMLETVHGLLRGSTNENF